MAVNSQPPVTLDPSQDNGHQLAFINQNFQAIANSLNPFILSDGSNGRLLLGKDSTGNYVLKISAAGFDAFNAANANLLFNSDQNTFKIVQTGTSTVTVPGPSTAGIRISAVISHNLGYVPAVFTYVSTPPGFGGATGSTPTPWTSYSNSGTLEFIADYYAVTATTIQFYTQVTNVNPTGWDGVWSFKYYLLQETFS